MSEREARAAWSALAEPGDAAAATLVSSLGAAEALAWVRRGIASLDGVVADLVGHMTRDEAVAVVAGHERWARRLEWANAPLLERARKVGARVVVPGDEEWPTSLAALGRAAPFALWVRGAGRLATLWDRAIAVVGARACTAYGENVTGSLAGGIADAGWIVLSGGAYGIDGVAHRVALESESPTIAVMAGGVDRLYPAGNEQMLRAVLDVGCVVSEVPVGFAPHRSRFLQRNRLIATAAGTVVVEAAFRSGALSTARQAAALCRPVGAVPGPVTSASSAGCHALIREGVATIVTAVADVLELVTPLTQAPAIAGEGDSGGPDGDGGAGEGRRSRPDFARPEQRAVFDATSTRPRTTDDVARRCGLSLAAAQAALVELEGLGVIARERGGWRKAPAPLSAKKRT